MATTKDIAAVKGQLNRNRNDLLTAKNARNNALNQSSAANMSPEERAKFRRLYKKYDDAVKRLEKERKDLTKKLNEVEREVEKPKGEKLATELQEKYNALKDSYDSLPDKTSEDAKSIKDQMDSLIDDFQKAYSKSVGSPVSTAVAKAKLTGTDLSKVGASGTAGEAVTLVATKTAKETADKESKGKTTKEMPEKTWGAGAEAKGGTDTTFQEPMTIAGQVSTTGGMSGAKKPSKFEDLIKRTEFWYNLPDYIFKINPALQDILVKAVDQEWTDEKFLAAAQQTPWWQQNAAAIRTRIVDKAKYDELRSQGLDVSKTDYGLDSATIKRKIKSLAQQKGANLTEDQLDQITAQAYNGFLENDNNALTQLIAPYIGTIPAILGKGLPGAGGVTSTYSGEALKNYQALQDIARQNGFKLQDILPRISTTTTGGNLENAVLQKLANGELDVNAIAQNARMLAAAGQPQYVRDLLNQGYDLSAVYAPYRTAMAGVLELNPDQIDLNDPTLRMGITDKGDMNLYDYRKLLKQDNRWQYTANAAQEVSDSALRVLRDFGMMG
jgi:uncharacterized protein YukE